MRVFHKVFSLEKTPCPEFHSHPRVIVKNMQTAVYSTKMFYVSGSQQ
jgi:hypothetical protein